MNIMSHGSSFLHSSAIFYSIINLASKGDNIVSARALYGGTFTMFNDILPKFGIEVRFVDAEDPKNFAAAMDGKTRAFFCESVSNPALEICDLEVISAGAHEHGLPLICDSTFSTVSAIIYQLFASFLKKDIVSLTSYSLYSALSLQAIRVWS